MKTIDKRFRLINLDILENCFAYLSETFKRWHDKPDVAIVVTVQVMDKDKARSLAQNSLYWAWIKIIGDKYGDTKEELHIQLKRHHLSKIYMRDDPSFAKTVEAVRQYGKFATKQEYERLAQGMAGLMTTTKATTKQFAEYLDDIDKHYYGKGLMLPKPDDYNWIIHDL